LDHEEFQEICVLFSACDKLEPCSSGCVSGHVDCASACDGDYMILDDPTRNVNYNGELGPFCDDSSQYTSPDWKGPGWYKMDEAIGTQIPEEVVDPSSCGTYLAGYLNGTHPSTVGELKDVNVCFSWSSDSCHGNNMIQVANCGNFYLYNLVTTPGCRYRYCSK